MIGDKCNAEDDGTLIGRDECAIVDGRGGVAATELLPLGEVSSDGAPDVVDIGASRPSRAPTPGMSSIAESSAAAERYLGVRLPDDGGENGSIPTIGNVWLLGRWNPLAPPCPPPSRGWIGMNGLGPLAESGVKKGEVGLVRPGEKGLLVWSPKTLGNEGLLAEWNGRWPCVNSAKASSASLFTLSSVFPAGSTGDAMPLLVGEKPLGV